MEPHVFSALMALAGVALGAGVTGFWSSRQLNRRLDFEREQHLREERRALFADFVALALGIAADISANPKGSERSKGAVLDRGKELSARGLEIGMLAGEEARTLAAQVIEQVGKALIELGELQDGEWLSREPRIEAIEEALGEFAKGLCGTSSRSALGDRRQAR